MKYILRMFGLVRIKDLNEFLENEVMFWEEQRKKLTNTEDILHENYKNKFENYAECSRILKIEIYNLNKSW